MDSFGKRLKEVSERTNRLCVGIDPHPYLLDEWGVDLREFSQICVEAFAGRVAMVKPQVAFYEAEGARGFSILEETIGQLREAGTLVLADAKRGDIGSTMAAYSRAWLGQGAPLEVDAVTLSPYLGVGSLTPAFDLAAENGKGVFVLGATSNPEASTVQGCVTSEGITLAEDVIGGVDALNKKHFAGEDLGSFGVVFGATVTLDANIGAFTGPVLLPGVGAQGATVEDVNRLMRGNVGRAFPNISRALLSHGPNVSDLQQECDSLAGSLS